MNSDREGPSGRIFNLPFMKSRKIDHERRELRLPGIGFLPNKIRNHIVAMIGEFTGTFLFLFFAFSATQVANAAASGNASGQTATGNSGLSQRPNASTLAYISLAFGFSLAVNAWVFFRISGGLFNPAVTFGMALIGAVGWVRASLIFISQILGAMTSAGVVSVLFPGPLNVSTTLGTSTSVARGLFIEMFATSELVFTIFMLAAEKHKGTYLAPVGIGLALFISELSTVYFTGGSLNPARSFGPCVANRDFPSYHWIYWVGPALGSLLAVCFYQLVKTLEYETANPGQDFNEQEKAVFVFDEETAVTADDVARPNVAAAGIESTLSDGVGSIVSREVSKASGQVPGSGGRVLQQGRTSKETGRGGSRIRGSRDGVRSDGTGWVHTSRDGGIADGASPVPSNRDGMMMDGARLVPGSRDGVVTDGMSSDPVRAAAAHHDEHHTWHDAPATLLQNIAANQDASEAEKGMSVEQSRT